MNFKYYNLIKRNEYLLSIIIYFLSIIMLILFFEYFFEIDKDIQYNLKENSMFLVLQIIIRNSLNFLQYILFAPFMIIFYILDCIYTSWAITVSINTNGIYNTFLKIFPHGILEIPNFALYTCISYKLMKNFYFNFRCEDYKILKDILNYKYILLLNFLLIIIAAIVEGIIT